MAYLSELSMLEVKYILIALLRPKLFLQNAERCSHSHDENFIQQHNNLIRITWKDISIPLVTSLFRNLKLISQSEPYLESVILEFEHIISYKYPSDMVLWCASLLVKYHEKKECSEYLTLALKFKLVAYLTFVKYHENFVLFRVKSMKIIVDFLPYVAKYKCKHELFKSYLNEFSNYLFFDYEDDHYFQTELPKVFNAAYELRFNILRFCNKYIQKLILKSVKSYLLVAKYGYEDQRYSRFLFYYDIWITFDDSDNLFGFKRRVIRRKRNKKYRPYQVLYLYIQAYYDHAEQNYGKEVYDEALRVLWNSIPDPYLSRNQFLSSFEQYKQYPEFLKTWKWYTKIVLNDVEPAKSPRSLKHLARCTIRRVLTEFVQMPFGIEKLSIPSSLKSYLGLKNVFSVQLCYGYETI